MSLWLRIVSAGVVLTLFVILAAAGYLRCRGETATLFDAVNWLA